MEHNDRPVEENTEEFNYYVNNINGLRKVRGWREETIPITITDICCEGIDHEILVRRYYEETQRTLFKLSSMAEASNYLVCMKDAYRFKKNDVTVYRVVTRGWHDISLKDVFCPNAPHRYSEVAKKFRSDWKKPSQRASFWSAMLPLARGIQCLHQSRMLYPLISLDTFRFWTEDEFVYSNFYNGRLDFAQLRLADAEVMVPFGRFITDTVTKNPCDIENHAANWRSFGGVIVDCLNRCLSPELHEVRKNEIRNEEISKMFDYGRLIEEEFLFLTQLLNISIEPQPDIIIKEMEVIHAKLAHSGGATNNLRKVLLHYNPKRIEHLFLGGYDQTLDPEQLNKALSAKLSKGDVHFLDSSSSPIAFFDCGDNLWFKGYILSYQGEESSQCLNLVLSSHQYSRWQPTVKESLAGFNVECSGNLSVTQKKLKSENYEDWALWKERSKKQYLHSAEKDRRTTILATFELANQLESLMAFLNLYTCKIINIYEENDGSIKAELQPVIPKSKISELQKKIRDIAGLKSEGISKDMFIYLKDQIERLHEHNHYLAIAHEDYAGSLSVNLGVGGKNLDKRMWKFKLISDPLFNNSDQPKPDNDEPAVIINIERHFALTDQEKSFFVKGNQISVRTRGHYGQMAVIERRTEAIKQLQKYDLLIEQLNNPPRKIGQTYENNFEEPLASILNNGKIDEDRLDMNKLAILEDILSNKPLFCLQGPPGTGKSETVRSLARLIFIDDPMCQILLTSRENSTVNDLLHKIRNDFKTWDNRPIINAYGGKFDNSEKGTQLTNILNDALQKVCSCNEKTPIITKWQQQLESLCGNTPDPIDRIALENLLERSANFIFSTASDKTLSKQVNAGFMYDWAIVEEAGRTPCYDMVLPMLAAQRWVLLGDQNQLSPFQSKEFKRMLEQSRETRHLLGQVAELDKYQKYVSQEFIRVAENRCTDEQNKFFNKDWIEAFDHLYKAIGSKDPVREEANGTTTACLNTIYRLPPILTELLRRVFYSDGINNYNTLKPAAMTKAQDSKDPFMPSSLRLNPVSEPPFLIKHNCVWIKTPSGNEYVQDLESGGLSNTGEAKLIGLLLEKMNFFDTSSGQSLAILTPYKKQVEKIENLLKDPAYEELTKKFKPVILNKKGRTKWVSTVDSFQGGEADIVILSLVRNTPNIQEATPKIISFIRDAQRANVMLSRARRLLIIVGSNEYFKRCYNNVTKEDESCKFLKFLKTFDELSEMPETSSYIRFVDVETIKEFYV